MKKWRPRIQSEYNVVDREGKIITSKEIIETLESLEVELSTARGERDSICELYDLTCEKYEKLQAENERLKARVDGLKDKLDFHGIPIPKETPK